MPLFRSSLGGMPTGFKMPQSSSPSGSAPMTPRTSLGGLEAVSGRPSTSSARSSRSVVYPPCGGLSEDEAAAQRLAKRMTARNIDYHSPEPPSKGKASAVATRASGAAMGLGGAASGEEDADGGGSVEGVAATEGLGGSAGETVAGAAAGVSADAAAAPDEAEEVAVVVPRYPESAYGKVYFQIETDGATRHESVGIIIVDVVENGVQMFDRLGRQHGNRPDPGYPLKADEVAKLAAGATLKVGTKSVLLVTALKEEAFRSGEFFLRSEHDQRKKEDKRRAMEAAKEQLLQSTVPKMTFGHKVGAAMGTAFGQPVLRKRPREGCTGFVVPLAGRPKLGPGGVVLGELKALHDHDREGAVVLFRADYKRDANGRPQVSVVVDPVIGDKLRPHQRIGVKFLFDCITAERMPGYHGAILADEMGLGKTIQTVATVYTCLKQGKHGLPTARQALVVAPSSLVRNWCNEFDKWLGVGAVKYFAISESTPKGDRILSRFDGEGDVLVISYDQLRKYIARLCAMRGIELVVCDEGHRLKNAEVKTTKAIDLLPTRNRIILSGTPIQNDLSEFHAMVGFVNPGILGNRDLFARVFEDPIMLGRDPDCPEHLKQLGVDRAHYLSQLTQRFILRRTQTINESYLPAKVDVTVFVRLGEAQRRAYESLSAMIDTGVFTPLVLISAFRKLCNHMDLFKDAISSEAVTRGGARGPGRPRQATATVTAAKSKAGGGGRRGPGRTRGGEKENDDDDEEEDKKGGGARAKQAGAVAPIKSLIPKGYTPRTLSQSYGSKMEFVSLMLTELVTNGDRDKLVIVSNFTQTLDIIARLCESKRVSYFQLDGSTPIKRRQELVDRFNVPGSQEIVFLLSSKAGGVGLNLIGANRLILFDPDWNPANDAQAMGRVWRDGQKKRVFIYRLLSTGSIEEKIYQRQVSKQGLSANVVDMKDDSKQHFTMDELKALFLYRPSTACDTHDLLNCRCGAGSRGKGSGEAEERTMRFRKVGQPKSGPRMDELKSWMHVDTCASFQLDKVLSAMARKAPDLVSFLFANERDTQKDKPREAVAVTVERPFEKDADGIVCPSQATCDDEDSEFEIEIHSDDDDDDDDDDDEASD